MKSRNPLKLDPTRTGMIRRAWVADTNRRFTKFASLVKAYMGQNRLGLTANAYVFETDDKKIRRFRQWLQAQIDAGILEVNPISGEPKGMKPWMYTYIDSAYRKGLVSAYLAGKPELGKKMPHYDGAKSQFLASAFSRPERTSKLALLYTRSYDDLKGVTSTMATQLSRTLTDGVSHGKGPMEIARTMTKQIKGINRQRARVIARTEVIHAHAEGQLDGLSDLGIENVTADVEWSTAGDDGVCPKCEALEGKTFSLKKAHGMIPLHPNCRCSWLPIIESPVLKGAKK